MTPSIRSSRHPQLGKRWPSTSYPVLVMDNVFIVPSYTRLSNCIDLGCTLQIMTRTRNSSHSINVTLCCHQVGDVAVNPGGTYPNHHNPQQRGQSCVPQLSISCFRRKRASQQRWTCNPNIACRTYLEWYTRENVPTGNGPEPTRKR